MLQFTLSITIIHLTPCNVGFSGTLWEPKKMLGNLLEQHIGRKRSEQQCTAQLEKQREGYSNTMGKQNTVRNMNVYEGH